MKRIFIIVLICVGVLVLRPVTALAVNSVVVESGALDPGETGAQIHVLLTNDITARQIVVPLVIRGVTGGAFVTSLQITFAERLVDGSLNEIVVTNIYAAEDGTCKANGPGGFGAAVFTDGNPHPITFSPAGLMASRGRLFSPSFAPGADVTGSIVLVVDANTTQGSFEIDSTCTNPANHLLYVEDGTNDGVGPAFTRGVWTIGNPPVARDTSWLTSEDTPKSVAYLPASDADGDPLTFAITAGPDNGSISGFDANTGAFVYTPAGEYNGPDSLSFEAKDGGFPSNSAKVRITVSPVNDPPVARDTAFATGEDIAVGAQYQGYDIDSPSLTYIRVTGPFHGSITSFNSSTGAFIYQPGLNYSGPDSITFRINDGFLNSNDGVVHITVSALNDPPIARDTAIAVPTGASVNAQFQSYDVDGGPPTYAQLTGPFHGLFAGFNPASGEFTYTPDSGYVGSDSITFVVNDGLADSDPGTVRITVTPSDCLCACWMDPQCEGELNAIDVARTINVVFFNEIPTISLQCRTWDVDYNCDCALDAQDIAKVVEIVFFGDSNFCDPCALDCFPFVFAVPERPQATGETRK